MHQKYELTLPNRLIYYKLGGWSHLIYSELGDSINLTIMKIRRFATNASQIKKNNNRLVSTPRADVALDTTRTGRARLNVKK